MGALPDHSDARMGKEWQLQTAVTVFSNRWEIPALRRAVPLKSLISGL